MASLSLGLGLAVGSGGGVASPGVADIIGVVEQRQG